MHYSWGFFLGQAKEAIITTLIAWVAIDQRSPSALYFASDSRITWGSRERRWDVGRKLFACKRSADVFGYSGEVLFPSLVLGQITDAVDHGLLISSDDEAASRHAIFVGNVKLSFSNRFKAPDHDFLILQAARVAAGMPASFRVWRLTYSVGLKTWMDDEITLPTDHSGLVVAVGTGAGSLEQHVTQLLATPQGRTSRAIFWAFCDALKANADPLSGGAPQLIGIYRSEVPRVFGLLYDGQRYFQGLPLQDDILVDNVEWRDEHFQRVDGKSMQVIAGAQRHGR